MSLSISQLHLEGYVLISLRDYPRKLVDRTRLVDVWNKGKAGINNTFVAED